ncbi:MobF family relaxase [Actinomyces wuliandei]|uniref:MobF family relaxase n=1 Tax=Actinomyces wuliandei TaxID=2057743 RepID=UPI001C5A5615|nr:MobF family relaxase [Actinomyces wuliandei]
MITLRQLYDMGRPGQSIVDYLVDSVADGPGTQPAAHWGSSRYYADTGTPPGTWVGSGLAGLSDHQAGHDQPDDAPRPEGRRIRPGDTVTPQDLRTLVEHGANPLTDQPLGRPFPTHMTAQERAALLIKELPDDLTPDQREARVRQIQRATAKAASARAVHAFDHTFAPPKSVSLLWALGDQGVREQVEAAHHDAISHVVATMEADTVRTRTGTGGVVQEHTQGMVAAAYDHWDSRAGDPHLHTHLVVANRVQGEDGKWRTLDSRGALFPSLVAMSEAYDNHLMDGLAARLGVSFSPRTLSRTGRAQWQIDGVSDQLIEEFSRRHAQIDQAREADASHHWDADTKAWASTRSAKEHRPLSELTAAWHQRAAEVTGGADPLAGVTNRPLPQPGAPGPQPGTRQPPARSADLTDDQVNQMAHRVVSVLQATRPSWTDWNIRAEAERTLRGTRCETPTEHDHLRQRLTQAATGLCVRVDDVDRAHTPARWRRPDGSSRLVPEHDAILTTQQLLDAEDYLVAVSQATTAPALNDARARVAAWTSPQGHRLAPDQAEAVTSVLTSGRDLDVMVGPAGTGKTTTLGALADTWQATHGPVTGLAPSSAAAQVLSESLRIPTANTAQWLTAQAHGASPLRPGQLLIIDEASMAATLPLAQIVSRAQAAGAKVVCVGDPDQLGAVEAGGGFGMLVRRRDDPPTLSTVRRFHEAWQAQASLLLREGDASVLTTYDQAGCVTSGARDDVLDQVYTAWASDRAAGTDSLMIASDNETVAHLNTRARGDLIAAGTVAGRETTLHDGTHASAGDQVVTRKNARHLGTPGHSVLNGTTWDVIAARTDGSLLVTPTTDPTAPATSLPADYVASQVELAYATTAHRSQGRTTERAHTVVDSTMTRQSLYVAMTRARGDNIAHVVLDDPHPDTDDLPTTDKLEDDPLAVLAAVLRRDGADHTARESSAQASTRASTVKQLADEYDTIAKGDAADGWQNALPDLLPHHADALAADPHYDALCSLLARRAAAGTDVRTLLPRLAGPHNPLTSTTRPASELAARLGTVPDPTTPSRPLIAGLITPAPPASDPDTQLALDDRADRIETRAAHVLSHALATNQPWTHHLGTPPTNPTQKEAWTRAATTVAAYRDRYQVTDGTKDDSPHMDPLGTRPIGNTHKQQQHDRTTAQAALRRARRLTHNHHNQHNPQQGKHSRHRGHDHHAPAPPPHQPPTT